MLLNATVLSAKVHTELVYVIFVPQRVNHQPLLTTKPSPQLPTPVKLSSLIKFLDSVKFLISGFSHGFRLHFQGPRQPLNSKNLSSAVQNPQVVDKKLEQELAANRLAGPFTIPPFQSFCVSPLGLVPKKVPGDFRLIHHLSFSKGQLINNGIAPEHTHVQYATIADAIRLVKRAGRGCLLAKTDIKSAFRIIPIYPQDYPLLGFKWWGSYYYDCCMPMGCSSSCKTFKLSALLLNGLLDRSLKLTISFTY